MSFYRTGTLSLTNGSATVTGSGTDFISGAAIGECVQAPDGKLYEITVITSATGLTLGQVYLGSTASGQSYSIVPTQSYIRDLAGQAATLVNGFATTRDNAVLLTVADKATPVDADKVAIKDSTTGFAKWLTWANLKATLKTYLSGVAFPIGATTPSTGAFTTLSASGNITATAAQPYISLIDSGWGVGATIRTGVNTIGTAIGDYLMLNVPTGKGISLSQNNATSLAVFDTSGLAVTGGISATGTLSVTGGDSTTRVYLQNGATSVGYMGVAYGYFGSGSTTDFAIAGYSNNLIFASGAVERMRLDTSGNLGLGVTPSAWGGYKAFQMGGGAVASYSAVNNYQLEILDNAYATGASIFVYANTSVNGAGRYQLANASHTWYTAPSGTAGNPITFVQAMTLDASGNLLVGAASFAVSPNAGIAMAATGAINIGNPLAAGSGWGFVNLSHDGVAIGSITQNGTTAVAYNTTSDHRLKTNVRPANAARFMDIEFMDFEWTDGRHDCGVIAHQLQSVYPDLVLGEKDATEVRQVEIAPAVPAVLDEEGVAVTPAIEAVTEEQTFPVYQQVNYIGLIGRMGTTIQKQQRLIEAMEARLTALEAA